ncbi:MAG: adenosylhomocysteinase [Thermotogota bacterium]|nr:adenosylhomocysteinase [Thermotogota bacterium]
MNKSVELGVKKMEWAWQYMDVLRAIKERYIDEKPFKGSKVVVCCHLEAKTANLGRLIGDLGAEVWVTGSNPLSTQDDIADALREHYGVTVHAKHTNDDEAFRKNLYKVLELEPDLILDDGGDLATIVHTEYTNYLKNLKGISEETTTGVHRLRALDAAGKLKVPAIAANDGMMKYLFDNRYGTGQSTWDGIIRSTNVSIAGKTVVVAGYGWCGRGVALRAKGLGAKVIVTEVDPIKSIEAVMDGFEVMSMINAAPLGDIFATLTGDINVITKEHFPLMKEGAILANAGHFDVEISMKQLREFSVEQWEARPNVMGYKLPNGKSIYVIAEGRLVNLAAADGHPIEIMDTSFGVQLMSLKYLWENKGKLENHLMSVPERIDRELAVIKLKTMGIAIDELTVEQKKYLSSW